MCSFKPQAARAVPPCGCVSTPGHGAVCEVGVQGKPRCAAWQRGLSTALPVPLVLHSPTKRLAPWHCRTRSYRATRWWSAPQRKRARDLMGSMARHWAQPGVWLLYLLVVVLQFLGIFKLVSSLSGVAVGIRQGGRIMSLCTGKVWIFLPAKLFQKYEMS